jgi:diacylglycerol kinase (ATP)
MYSALRQLFGYQGIAIGATGNGQAPVLVQHLMLIIANGKNFGGTFRIAPNASITDGQLDAIAFRIAPPMRRMKLFAAAARGTHVGLPDVSAEKSDVFTLTFASPPAYETDGEYNRAKTATLEVKCVPAALRVVVPHGT